MERGTIEPPELPSGYGSYPMEQPSVEDLLSFYLEYREDGGTAIKELEKLARDNPDVVEELCRESEVH